VTDTESDGESTATESNNTDEDIDEPDPDCEIPTESPCIGVCTLDETGSFCTACGQTLEELMK
jgi:hypothetical protein